MKFKWLTIASLVLVTACSSNAGKNEELRNTAIRDYIAANNIEDVKKLLEVLHTLVDKGNTVIVIEHNLEVIKTADHIIDLGPEGGKNGGRIICNGTPEAVANNKKSFTARFLRKELKL